MQAYTDFLAQAHRCADDWADVTPNDIHPALFPFQRDLVAWAVPGGRAALFADTGLGKTRMQVSGRGWWVCRR